MGSSISRTFFWETQSPAEPSATAKPYHLYIYIYILFESTMSVTHFLQVETAPGLDLIFAAA